MYNKKLVTIADVMGAVMAYAHIIIQDDSGMETTFVHPVNGKYEIIVFSYSDGEWKDYDFYGTATIVETIHYLMEALHMELDVYTA